MWFSRSPWAAVGPIAPGWTNWRARCGSPTGWGIVPLNSPAVSSSGWRWPGLSSRVPTCFSRTSRPATSTRSRQPSCSPRSAGRSMSTARAWSWSPTTLAPLRTRIGCFSSPMADWSKSCMTPPPTGSSTPYASWGRKGADMWRVTVKGVVAHRLRYALTALAVLLGVAFISGTFVLTDTINATFDGLYNQIYRGTAAVVRAEQPFNPGTNFTNQRQLIDASLAATLRTVSGVKAVSPDIEGYAQLVGHNGKPIGKATNGPPTLG